MQWLAAGEDDNKDPPERGRQKPKFWLWACLAGNTARMRILPTRGLDSACQLLAALVGQSGLTVLVCDCYSTYKAFAKQYPGQVVLAHCWAHMRRNFVRVGTGHADRKAWAEEWVERIGELFRLNRQRLQQWDRQQPLEGQGRQFQQIQQQLQTRVQELFERVREEGRGVRARVAAARPSGPRPARCRAGPPGCARTGPWRPCRVTAQR